MDGREESDPVFFYFVSFVTSGVSFGNKSSKWTLSGKKRLSVKSVFHYVLD